MSNSTLLKCLNLRMLALPVGSVFAGAAAARISGNLEVLPLVLLLLFGIFLQLSFNLRHRYYDIKYKFGEYIDDGISLANKDSLPLNAVLREGSKGMLLMALTAGIGIFVMAGWWALLFCLAIFALGWVNYAGQRQLSRTPWGIFVTFLLFGPLGTMCCEVVQLVVSSHNAISDISMVSWPVIGPGFYMSIATGLLAMNAHISLCYVNYNQDLENNKRTFTVTFGKKAAETVYFTNGFLVIAAFAVMFLFGHIVYRWYAIIIPILSCIFNTITYRAITKAQTRELQMKYVNYTFYNVLFLTIALLIFFSFFGHRDLSPSIYF